MPLSTDTNINRLITGFARDFNNANLIADQVLTSVKVQKEQGKFARYDKDKFRTGGINSQSTDKDIALVTDHGVDTDSYSTVLHRLAQVVGVLEGENADAPFNPLQDATENVMAQLLTEKETLFATAIIASGNYATGSKAALVNSTQWSNYTTATGAIGPVHKVHSAIDTIRGLTARRGNTLIVSADVHTQLLRHPDVTDSLKFVQTLMVTNISAALAGVFGVARYFILDAIKNTALEGESDSLSDIATKEVALLHVPERQTSKSVAHTVQFQQRMFPNGNRWTVDERMGATIIEVRDNYVFNLVDDTAGFFFDNAIA